MCFSRSYLLLLYYLILVKKSTVLCVFYAFYSIVCGFHNADLTNKKNLLIIFFIFEHLSVSDREKGYDEEEYIEDVSREDDSPAERLSGAASMEGSF